jgi:hypothetical protein
MEVARSSSRPFDPASSALRRRGCRDLVMGRRRGTGVGTKLQHIAAFRSGRRPTKVTGLTIHDNVIAQRFPPLIFCSKAFKFQHKRCALAGPN